MRGRHPASHASCRGSGYCHRHYADRRQIDCGGHGLPPQDDVADLIRDLKAGIADDDRADEDGDEPGILLTIGYSPDDGTWGWQTGDNSFTGGAYGHPHWSVQPIRRDTDPDELADEMLSEIADLTR